MPSTASRPSSAPSVPTPPTSGATSTPPARASGSVSSSSRRAAPAAGRRLQQQQDRRGDDQQDDGEPAALDAEAGRGGRAAVAVAEHLGVVLQREGHRRTRSWPRPGRRRRCPSTCAVTSRLRGCCRAASPSGTGRCARRHVAEPHPTAGRRVDQQVADGGRLCRAPRLPPDHDVEDLLLLVQAADRQARSRVVAARRTSPGVMPYCSAAARLTSTSTVGSSGTVSTAPRGRPASARGPAHLLGLGPQLAEVVTEHPHHQWVRRAGLRGADPVLGVGRPAGAARDSRRRPA